MGSSTMVVPSGAMWSTSALHDCRTRPLMRIVHEPHTSSRHTDSHATGVVFSPEAVTGRRWISMSALMTFIRGCQGSANSCQ